MQTDLEAPFLSDIAANPHDWLPRLVFADWLEEQGDERGELIRLSHDLTRLKCDDRSTKEKRLQELRRNGVQWPTPKLPNRFGIEFVLIPPGEFLMGSPPDEPGRNEEEVQREVVLTKGFWLGKYPVTLGEYRKYASRHKTYHDPNDIPEDADRHPVVSISLTQATKFAFKFTEREQKTNPMLQNWKFALPSEEQWEYACRAGTTSATAFGDSLSSQQANFYGAFPYGGAEEGPSHMRTVAVGNYSPNAWGLHDMHGNVLEKCRDQELEEVIAGRLSKAEYSGYCGTFKGGCFLYEGFDCRSAAFQHGRNEAISIGGLRLALIPEAD